METATTTFLPEDETLTHRLETPYGVVSLRVPYYDRAWLGTVVVETPEPGLRGGGRLWAVSGRWGYFGAPGVWETDRTWTNPDNVEHRLRALAADYGPDPDAPATAEEARESGENLIQAVTAALNLFLFAHPGWVEFGWARREIEWCTQEDVRLKAEIVDLQTARDAIGRRQDAALRRALTLGKETK